MTYEAYLHALPRPEVTVSSPSPETTKSSGKKKTAARRGAGKKEAAIVWKHEAKPLSPVVAGNLPAFPQNAIPAAFAGVIEDLASAYRQSIDAPALMLHFLTAAALGKSFTVRDQAGHSHSLNLAVGLFTHNPARMAGMVRAMSLPLARKIDADHRAHASAFGRNIQWNAMRAAKLRALERSKAVDDDKVDELFEQIASLREELANDWIPPKPPHVLSDLRRVDILRRLQAHGDCGAILSLEGLAVARRMGKEPSLYNALLRGDRVEGSATRDSIVDGPQHIEPCLSAMLIFPASEATDLFAKEVAGPLDHFALVHIEQPESLDDARPLTLSDGVTMLLADHFAKCMELRRGRLKESLVLHLDSKAEDARDAYARSLWKSVSADDSAGTGIAGPESAVLLATKLAGLLHVVQDEDLNPTIPLETWQAAEELAGYLMAHTQAMRLSAVENSAMEPAQLLIDRAHQLGEQFTLSEVLSKGWRGLRERGQAMAAINILLEFGYLQKGIRTHGNSGGRPTTVYHWWPDVFKVKTVSSAEEQAEPKQDDEGKAAKTPAEKSKS